MKTWSKSDLEFVLGRSPKPLDLESARSFFCNRTTLVTGAGGSIGSEICRQLAGLGARRIVGLDYSDHALVDLISRYEGPPGSLSEFLCDVRDPLRLDICLRQAKPDIVIHAAALKHVHMGDRHPGESTLTNLVAVRNALDAAERAGASTFVFISSDKAAAPSGVMGALKRLAELFLMGEQRRLAAMGSKMRVLTVRFGNVFGSQGSVVPLFARQIADGGPITVTHRAMQRYFMTAEEAVQLILRTCALKQGDAAARGAFLLDMGEPVRVLDIARRMMEVEGVDLPIAITGVREGEKLEEDLYDESETIVHSGLEGVLRIDADPGTEPLGRVELDSLEKLARQASDRAVRQRIFALLDKRFAAGVGAAGLVG